MAWGPPSTLPPPYHHATAHDTCDTAPQISPPPTIYDNRQASRGDGHCAPPNFSTLPRILLMPSHCIHHHVAVGGSSSSVHLDRLYEEEDEANHSLLLMGIVGAEVLAGLVPGLAASGLF
eukprot:CAMPEP_0201905274 /NCGR_PEP_ID=MMETSP0902-20130614/56427_1 /ASSEMBLY_ACC=CAM_ASM_000551 /TAXON_ID=420261 /ORGANISM="Thalassiosira antarctica, Strain CCMP982" /LENGTH=119 /DNA_ID=CAMNT_0048439385 /DNA_START=395 /DNA_END=755 /DNA_ORIENTATION=-